MKKITLALAALAALGSLAATTEPASARVWRRTVVTVVPPVYPVITPVIVAPRVVYRAPYRVKRVKRVVVYR